ncbi:hypothetical protein [Peribacillus frigoritolerans]|uniref:hypothetical protein n=1 Tax=Peribacillus frigoritolerans TaxID=450367 RepID=UPI00207A7F40|nr:hypothetical protein [Peribacillus frigoritolerans]USK64828.1 hypothetical protein LIT26_27615 [Peribacillus frigoritolerans]
MFGYSKQIPFNVNRLVKKEFCLVNKIPFLQHSEGQYSSPIKNPWITQAWNTEDISRKELNTLAKEIIDRIELIRDGDKVQISINFL